MRETTVPLFPTFPETPDLKSDIISSPAPISLPKSETASPTKLLISFVVSPITDTCLPPIEPNRIFALGEMISLKFIVTL